MKGTELGHAESDGYSFFLRTCRSFPCHSDGPVIYNSNDGLNWLVSHHYSYGVVETYNVKRQ